MDMYHRIRETQDSYYVAHALKMDTVAYLHNIIAREKLRWTRNI